MRVSPHIVFAPAPMSTENTRFRKKQRIGSGGHGSVYKAKTPEGSRAALKVTTADDVHTARELEAMQTLQSVNPHPNVISYVSQPYRDDVGYVFQPFELCECDLMTFVEQYQTIVSEHMLRPIFKQVLDGLKHCHAHGVYHLDIKPENILKKKSCFKLADFGSSKILRPSPVEVSNLESGASSPVTPIRITPGTVLYASPESFMFDMATDGVKADVWALGITIFSCLSAVFPWAEASDYDENFLAWEHAFESEDSHAAAMDYIHRLSPVPVSTELRDLLAIMLHVDPARRASLEDVCAHAWFAL